MAQLTNDGFAAALKAAIETLQQPNQPTMVTRQEIGELNLSGDVISDYYNIKNYMKKLDRLYEIKKITDPTIKRDNLLILGGEKIERCHILPDPAAEMDDYKKLISKIKKIYMSKDLRIYFRMKFQQKTQGKHQSNRQWFAELEEFVPNCRYSESDDPAQVKAANELQLITQVAINARIEKIQLKALEDGITWDNLTDFATSLDTRTAQAEEIREARGDARTGHVHRIDGRRPQRRYPTSKRRANNVPKQCMHCGSKPGHFDRENECRAFHDKCRTCNKKGHWEAYCQSGPKKSKNTYPKRNQKYARKIEEAETETESDEQPESDNDSIPSYSDHSDSDDESLLVNYVQHLKVQH